MGCGGSTMPMPPMPTEEFNKMKLEIPSPIAFSVPLTEEEESVVKKHPPKRLRMLEGQQSPPLTHEMLLEKLADAENRRQQILSQRIESAKTLMRPRYNSANKMNADDALVEDADNVGEEDS
ncbi:Uncharacterized protein FWK35_00031528 [Aphis craccivora]|uniref:Uncharacterized protein n=1 Tax=Aphis craccivora TaxID=307492 RepID=A0A6G0YE68_APHCR|nr:Uncharacterized protein FWK35_00031528 [Aphis craccivora]